MAAAMGAAIFYDWNENNQGDQKKHNKLIPGFQGHDPGVFSIKFDFSIVLKHFSI